MKVVQERKTTTPVSRFGNLGGLWVRNCSQSHRRALETTSETWCQRSMRRREKKDRASWQKYERWCLVPPMKQVDAETRYEAVEAIRASGYAVIS